MHFITTVTDVGLTDDYGNYPFVVVISRLFLVHDVLPKTRINGFNMMCATSDAGIVYPSGAPEFTPYFSRVRVAQSYGNLILFC